MLVDGLLRFISVAPMALPINLPHSNSGKGEATSVALSLRRDLRQQLAPHISGLSRNMASLGQSLDWLTLHSHQ